MRLAALAMMRRLAPFRPRLIGSVLTGHVRQGSDIDLHVFSDTAEAVTHLLDQDGLATTSSGSRSASTAKSAIFTHIHVDGPLPVRADASTRPTRPTTSSRARSPARRSSGPASPSWSSSWRASIPDLDLAAAADEAASQVDRFQVYRIAAVAAGEREADRSSIIPRATRSTTACRCSTSPAIELAYDEEFLLAALLHDIGKAIDPTTTWPPAWRRSTASSPSARPG